jgi:hypothetical protein
MTHDPTNADRAAWAKDALAVFTSATFSGDHPDTMDKNDLASATSDLIADLLHFAVQQGFDAGAIMQSACGHFGFELLEQACHGRTMFDRGITSRLIGAIHYLLEQTLDRDRKYGITLSEGEQDARTKALSAVAEAVEAAYRHANSTLTN